MTHASNIHLAPTAAWLLPGLANPTTAVHLRTPRFPTEIHGGSFCVSSLRSGSERLPNSRLSKSQRKKSSPFWIIVRRISASLHWYAQLSPCGTTKFLFIRSRSGASARGAMRRDPASSDKAGAGTLDTFHGGRGNRGNPGTAKPKLSGGPARSCTVGPALQYRCPHSGGA